MPEIQISRGYLNLSRKFATMITELNVDGKSADEIDTIKFSLYSGTIIYAYSAVDAFTNRFLLNAWLESKKLNTPENIAVGYNVEALKELKKNSSSVSEFRDFKNTKYSEVKERIKFICKVASIKSVHDVNPSLWENLLKILRDQRNFFVHVDSSSDNFEENVKTVFDTNDSNVYQETASKVLQHFYEQKGREIPSYLNSDDLIV